MGRELFTIMFIPPRSKGVKKWVVSKKALRRFVVGGCAFLILFVLCAFGSIKMLHQFAALKSAKNEVTFLENNLLAVQNRLSAADATLARIQNFEQKLRVITRLEDSSRNLAVGPLNSSNASSPQFRSDLLEDDLSIPEAYRFELKETHIKLSEVSETAILQEQTMHELYSVLQDQKALLSHTPSVWPTQGWTTSTFGYRTNPFTGRTQMHEGIDVATRIGTPVISPADGTVVQVRTYEGYGKTLVLDHGYGIITRYGHNSEILVKPGDRVHRGAVIAKVGNTGMSTGPHLHYEVRVNGIPVDPEKYILD